MNPQEPSEQVKAAIERAVVDIKAKTYINLDSPDKALKHFALVQLESDIQRVWAELLPFLAPPVTQPVAANGEKAVEAARAICDELSANPVPNICAHYASIIQRICFPASGLSDYDQAVLAAREIFTGVHIADADIPAMAAIIRRHFPATATATEQEGERFKNAVAYVAEYGQRSGLSRVIQVCQMTLQGEDMMDVLRHTATQQKEQK